MNMVKKLFVATVPLLVLAGCASTPESVTQAPVEETVPAQAAVDQPVAAVATAAPANTGFSGHVLDDPSSLLAKRVVYFDFDKSDISREARDIIASHAKYLADHSSARITLEGHADERGSREYNMGLGERRGNAVSKFLMLQGVAARQVEVISYGEERPAAFGHDESSWQLNRRAEILYKSR